MKTLLAIQYVMKLKARKPISYRIVLQIEFTHDSVLAILFPLMMNPFL